MEEILRNLLIYVLFNLARSFVNYVIFCGLCDWMRFEVDCVKSHHHIISDSLDR